MPCRNVVFLCAFAGLAACDGNTDPNNKPATELSPPPDNSAAAHMVTPPPGAPNVKPAAASAPSEPAETPAGPPPGFAGRWASTEGACKDPEKVYRFSARRIEMGAQRGCAVISIGEEHPTGRSMIYHVEGACIGEKRSENQSITFRFGASDTIMQVQVDDDPPERVVRCPPEDAPD
ncbi:MAG: hypothetical protein GC155_07650 [Alphaproteobacteria bacterium]|nr:hypothetical protein [Alphaproteobacteria bacterium]